MLPAAEPENPTAAREAAAKLHHAYFLGLQLMVSTREGPEVIGDWMFRLFRQQHEAKFLSSFDKLGLSDLPHAVACARYHVLSNGIGGVPVEYARESDQKAWVRFRYPRWMFAGPTICGVPVEASRGFLNGWYAHNGVSLQNPNLGFVCVSEDMTGQFGLCGYFREYSEPLAPAERLQFAPDEQPPAFVAEDQPTLPATQWSDERIAKANLNYAVEYIRNGVSTLIAVVGHERGIKLAEQAARLIGLQYYSELAEQLGVPDGDHRCTAEFLRRMFIGMGDTATVRIDEKTQQSVVEHKNLRILRGLADAPAQDLLRCWNQLWMGAIDAHQRFKEVQLESDDRVARSLADEQQTYQQRWRVTDKT